MIRWAEWVWLACATVAFAQEPTIFRPLDKTVFPMGPLTVIALGAASDKLLLDGRAIEYQQPAPGVHTVIIKPSAGVHELALGSAKVRFAIGPLAEGFRPFRQHPPAAPCTACHAIKDGAWGFRSDKLVESCAACHDLKAFPKSHMHNTEVLNECQLCHQPHGSTEKSHLKLSKETACKICHG